jgi:hypothetical protein
VLVDGADDGDVATLASAVEQASQLLVDTDLAITAASLRLATAVLEKQPAVAATVAEKVGRVGRCGGSVCPSTCSGTCPGSGVAPAWMIDRRSVAGNVWDGRALRRTVQLGIWANSSELRHGPWIQAHH